MVRTLESLHSEYKARTPRSMEQWERGKQTMPGGIIKGAYWKSPHPLYIDHASGCMLYDLDGNEYVDYANHHSATLLGHSHPDVVAAIHKELDRGIAFGNPTALEAEISEEIVARVPAIEKVRFSNSGTESSLHASRMIRAATGRRKIAKFEGAYHGSNDALEHSTNPALDAAGSIESPSVVPAHKGMSEGSEDEIVILPYSDRETVDLILREHKDEIAGVFFDGRPGMLDVSDDFASFLRDITKDLGMKLVVDEVVSFRTGPAGYQGLAGIQPDITIFGKVVGGGMPVGAIGGSAEMMDMLDNTGPPTGITQSGTFSGNNLTLAAGLATLRALTPEVYAHLDSIGQRLAQGLDQAYADAGIPCQVLQRGSVVNAYLTDHKVSDYRRLMTSDTATTTKINLALLLKGYNLGTAPMEFMLSSPLTDKHIDGFLEALSEVLAEED